MPMDPQQRAEAMKKLQTGSTPSDTVKAQGVAKQIPRLIRGIRRSLKDIDRQFQNLSGETQADKQTAMFDAISAEEDGSLILHDIAQLLDGCISVANTHRQPNDPVLTIPFTDADVDTYEA